ncbi:hypothetical protein LDENG_00210300 [Lucifuga dentata]|nr:hypothetical protein LDENG_00210300 [Lucifuga dentata]
MIIRLHRYQVKELIIREGRARRGKLRYRDSPIAIYEDYSPEVIEQHSRYRGMMADLYKLGLKPPLLFPAKLVIKAKDGSKRHFATVKEAEHYIVAICSDPQAQNVNAAQ